MINTPLISVIIPTHNYGAFIAEALESILRQDYPMDKIEIIVVDDGSTDNTREITHQYSGVTYVYEKHRGVAAARNTGMSLAVGEIITFLDADDIWLPARIKTVAEAFHKHPDVGIVFHSFDVMDSCGRTLHKNFYETFRFKRNQENSLLYDIIMGNVFCGGSSFSFKRTLLKHMFPIPEDIRRGVDFYASAVASCYAPAIYLQDILGKYRLHGKNLTFFADRNPMRLAAIHGDLSLTYEKVLVTLSGMKSANKKDLKALKWRRARSCLLFSVLSGNRIKAIKQVPALFKTAESMSAFLSNIGLLSVFVIPNMLYTYLANYFLYQRGSIK